MCHTCLASKRAAPIPIMVEEVDDMDDGTFTGKEKDYKCQTHARAHRCCFHFSLLILCRLVIKILLVGLAFLPYILGNVKPVTTSPSAYKKYGYATFCGISGFHVHLNCVLFLLFIRLLTSLLQ